MFQTKFKERNEENIQFRLHKYDQSFETSNGESHSRPVTFLSYLKLVCICLKSKTFNSYTRIGNMKYVL